MNPAFSFLFCDDIVPPKQIIPILDYQRIEFNLNDYQQLIALSLQLLLISSIHLSTILYIGMVVRRPEYLIQFLRDCFPKLCELILILRLH